MSVKKLEIKSRRDRGVLFSFETDRIKVALEAAVKQGADLGDANLRGADLRGANLGDADLGYADLRDADLGYADLRGANLGDADLRGANLGDADLGYADLRGANLGDADLGYADLGDANLRGADLRGADLGDAYLGGADLRGADLRGADLGDAYLGGADLRGADLRGADLRGANLGDADLGGANLGYADLRGANLGDADLGGADLGDAKGINPHFCTPLLMLLDQPGLIRAYKLIDSGGEGPYNGGICYEQGQSYSVESANTDPGAQCAAGIHLATLDWCMKHWREGFRILVVEFTAKDIAAIPTATNGKFRVHRCRVVAEKDLVEIGLVEKEKKSAA